MTRYTHLRRRSAAAEGRLLARPATPTAPGRSGLRGLGLDEPRDALLYVPESAGDGRGAPMMVVLHGAGGNAEGAILPLRHLADASGTILLAPESRDRTWDVIVDTYGPDVAFIDCALAVVFDAHAVDARRVAVAGFSDGASYALSIGVANGGLFTHAVAFSPGFLAPARQEGAPRIFVSHGTRDAVLPIDRCSRSIVPKLERAGYDVRYREFDGPHLVPAEIAAEAFEWFAGEAG